MQVGCQQMHNFSFFWIFAKKNYGSMIGSLSKKQIGKILQEQLNARFSRVHQSSKQMCDKWNKMKDKYETEKKENSGDWCIPF